MPEVYYLVIYYGQVWLYLGTDIGMRIKVKYANDLGNCLQEPYQIDKVAGKIGKYL